MAHAKLSPSAAYRWMNCPGSVRVQPEEEEGEESPFALEGTVAHNLAERMLWGEEPDEPEEYPGMLEHVKVYVDYVHNLKGTQSYEKKVDYSEYVPDGFGTSDAIVENDDTLHVIDLKYGKGLKVFAADNPQGQLYAIGALEDAAFMKHFSKVIITIVQPRLAHIDSWQTTPEALHAFGIAAKRAAEATEDPEAPFVPGDAQCRFCGFKAKCPALFEYTEQTTLALFDEMQDEPAILKQAEELSEEQLVKVLDHSKLIKDWLSSVEDYAHGQAMVGNAPKGYKLVEGKSNRHWSDEEEAEKVLSRLLGKKQAFVKKLLSPAQAEKSLKGDAKAKTIQTLITKPEGKPALVKDTDKRKAIKPATFEDESSE